MQKPSVYDALLAKSGEIGFTMGSDIGFGNLLKTLVASKTKGNFLELGTGTGLSLACIVAGMDTDSRVISLDNDAALVELVSTYFAEDQRVTIICEDAAVWIENNQRKRFDLIFADAWPGKFSQQNEVIALLKPGGFYVVDDLLPQFNWPQGHEVNVENFTRALAERKDMEVVNMDWSTGITIAVKK